MLLNENQNDQVATEIIWQIYVFQMYVFQMQQTWFDYNCNIL